MTPFAAAIVTSLGMLLAASLLLWNGVPVGAIAKTFPRSRRAAWVTMAISALWTLYHITQLGEADFGRYKVPIFIGFAALAVLSVIYVPDFLAVRGTCALTLLVAGLLLSATFMDYRAPSLLLNAFVYIAIVLALYLAVSPFRLRDFFQWMFVLPHRPRVLGAVLGAGGLLLLTTALFSA
jgi:hypothetical protein